MWPVQFDLVSHWNGRNVFVDHDGNIFNLSTVFWKEDSFILPFLFRLLVHSSLSIGQRRSIDLLLGYLFLFEFLTVSVDSLVVKKEDDHCETIAFSCRWTSECVELSFIDVVESSASFCLKSDSCCHCHQQAENNILYRKLKLQSINLDRTDFTRIRLKICQWKSQESSFTKQRELLFSDERQTQAIVDLKNNSNGKWFLTNNSSIDTSPSTDRCVDRSVHSDREWYRSNAKISKLNGQIRFDLFLSDWTIQNESLNIVGINSIPTIRYFF